MWWHCRRCGIFAGFTPLDFNLDRTVVTGDFLEITQYGYQASTYTIECGNLTKEDTYDTYDPYVDIPFLSYAGYVCYDVQTGQRLDISLDVPGKVRVIVPASYRETFTFVFREPWYWRIAELISVLHLLISSMWFFHGKKYGVIQGRISNE